MKNITEDKQMENLTENTASSKPSKPLRTFIIIIAIVCLIIALIPAVNSAVASAQKKTAENKFREVCSYVAENEDVYRKFSAYQLSLVEIGSKNQNGHFVNTEGDFQEERDIVLQDVMNAHAHYIRDKHNELTDRKTINYMIYAGKNYRVFIVYTEAGISDFDNELEYCTFGEDMVVYLYELDPALRHI